MKIFYFKITILISLVVSGCSVNPQLPIPYQVESVSETDTIAILIDQVPEAKMSYPGASCLLCYAAAAAVNGGLSEHTKSLSTAEVENYVSELEASLSTAGYSVVSIDNNSILLEDLPKNRSKAPNTTKRDFKKLAQKYDADKLLVIDIDYVGVQRMYSSYVPTSEPYASIIGNGSLIDPEENILIWYSPIDVKRFADGEWKEKPDYPNMTNAYYQAIEDVRQILLSPWSKEVGQIQIDSPPETLEEDTQTLSQK